MLSQELSEKPFYQTSSGKTSRKNKPNTHSKISTHDIERGRERKKEKRENY